MKIISTVVSVFFVVLSYSQTNTFKKIDTEKDIVQKINSASRNTRTIDSDFKQFKHLDILENDIESIGHFSFQASDKVRWEYSKPYNYLIIMNAGIMWINDGNKTQKYDTKTNKMFKEINDLMVGMLQGQILESDKFNVSFFENSNQVLGKLSPKTVEMKDFLTEIQLYFDKKDYSVASIKMLEISGDYTLIEFYNRKTNIEIPALKFLVK